ncbi:MAG TPA: aromatic amino acid ammonia-lyase [Gaiellaceae bacterium]|nr:aromatic amino acid ammonia-lyase [Gaiellaceae bacterium]
MARLDRYDALDLDTYRRIVLEGEPVEVDDALLEHVDRRREALLRHLGTGVQAYGVTTGLGYLASEPVREQDQPALQRSLLTARASGFGPSLPSDIVRGGMLLRLAGFLSGLPGVSSALCRFLVDRLNSGWSPVVPSGPYGASGEIAPLAHLFQTFIGEGLVDLDGERLSAREALARSGVEAYEPGPKEGLALVNGSPLATALAVRLGDRGGRLHEQATSVAALAIALVGASARPFALRVGTLGADPAEEEIARRLLDLLARGARWDSRRQPPVSFRVVPQVHGAMLGSLDELTTTIERRLRAVTDSPVFLDGQAAEPEGLYPSGAFHAIGVTLRLEAVAVAAAHVTNLVEKRLHRLLDARFSSLPEQLARDPGRQAGAVSLHKAVVGLAAESRLLAAPASVHAFDTSAGHEDVQALSFLAADRLDAILDNLESALACELVALRQAAHLSARPLDAPLLVRMVARLAEIVAPIDEDRTLSPDVERVVALLRAGEL